MTTHPLEGFGASTPGGTGGTTYNVTNLNNSGPGSAREAFTASGPRIVNIQVAGTVNLLSRITIMNPFITIKGETAPAGGICFKLADPASQEPCIWIETHDVIMQYLRLRPGFSVAGRSSESQTNNASALRMSKVGGEVYNIVLNHMSFSWAIDETISTWRYAHDITIQWCIISEAFTIPGVGSSFGMLLGQDAGSGNISVHHNLFAHNSQRNPFIDIPGTVDFVNNVLYNTNRHMDLRDTNGTPLVNIVGNYQKAGADTNLTRGHIVNSGTYTGSMYVANNISYWRPTDTGDELDGIVRDSDQVEVTGTRHTAPTISTETGPETALTEVLASAGAILPARDAVDQRIVDDVINGTGTIINAVPVSGYPDLTSPPTEFKLLSVQKRVIGGANFIYLIVEFYVNNILVHTEDFSWLVNTPADRAQYIRDKMAAWAENYAGLVALPVSYGVDNTVSAVADDTGWAADVGVQALIGVETAI